MNQLFVEAIISYLYLLVLLIDFVIIYLSLYKNKKYRILITLINSIILIISINLLIKMSASLIENFALSLSGIGQYYIKHYMNDMLNYLIIMTSLIMIALAILLILNSLIQIYFRKNIKGSSKILKKGVYRFIRHPQYLGYLIISTEVLLWSNIELKIAFLFMIVLLISHLSNYEEIVLTKKYGDEFVEYKSATKKLIPYIY